MATNMTTMIVRKSIRCLPVLLIFLKGSRKSNNIQHLMHNQVEDEISYFCKEIIQKFYYVFCKCHVIFLSGHQPNRITRCSSCVR